MKKVATIASLLLLATSAAHAGGRNGYHHHGGGGGGKVGLGVALGVILGAAAQAAPVYVAPVPREFPMELTNPPYCQISPHGYIHPLCAHLYAPQRVTVTQPPPPPPTAVWCYCNDPGASGYYPTQVRECRTPWIPVTPR